MTRPVARILSKAGPPSALAFIAPFVADNGDEYVGVR